jgi:hypothetical protein
MTGTQDRAGFARQAIAELIERPIDPPPARKPRKTKT